MLFKNNEDCSVDTEGTRWRRPPGWFWRESLGSRQNYLELPQLWQVLRYNPVCLQLNSNFDGFFYFYLFILFFLTILSSSLFQKCLKWRRENLIWEDQMNEDRDTEIKGEEGPDEGQLQSSQSLEEAVRRKYSPDDLICVLKYTLKSWHIIEN